MDNDEQIVFDEIVSWLLLLPPKSRAIELEKLRQDNPDIMAEVLCALQKELKT